VRKLQTFHVINLPCGMSVHYRTSHSLNCLVKANNR